MPTCILWLRILFAVAYLAESKMTNIHYIEFITNDTHAPAGHCVSKVMTMLHGIMRHTEKNLGVSFPSMRERERNGETQVFIGEKVRVFGTPEQLMPILANASIQDACRRGVCSLSVYVPTPVPTEHQLVCYKVSHHGGNNTSALAAKNIRRYERRHGQPMSKEDQRALKLYLANKVRPLPYFTIKHTEGIYPVYVEKMTVDVYAEGFNSHGLGNAGGVVFDF